MSIFDLKRRFGQSIDIEEVKNDFLSKIDHFLFGPIDKKMGRYYYSDHSGGAGMFDFICLELSMEPSEVVNSYNKRRYYSNDVLLPPVKQLTNKDFHLTLATVEAIYKYFQESSEYKKSEWIAKINNVVEISLDQLISIGVYWHEGRFFPEGAEELDQELIRDPLKWLDEYPKIKAIYENAREHFAQSLRTPIKRKDVISNAQQAVDAMTRMYLNNNYSFDRNYNNLIKKLSLSKHWGQILNRYNELSKELGRHPGRTDDFIPEHIETEAYLYLSGLLLRLILGKIEKG